MRKVIITLVVLIILAVGLGFYLDWFNLSTRRHPLNDGKVSLSLEVDTEKVKSDTEAAKEKVRELGEAAKENVKTLSGDVKVEGKVVEINEGAQHFTMMTAEGKELTIQLAPSAEVRLRNKEAQLHDLGPGDRVTVVYKVEDGKNVARSVTAERAT